MESSPRSEQRRITLELWPGDIDAVFGHLATRPGVDRTRVGVAGGSCGAGNAVQLAARHSEVSALVLLAGGETPAKDVLPRMPWVPVFAVASRDDEHYDAVASMRRVIGFSGNRGNRLMEYTTGGHGTDLFRVHPDLEPMIADWFVRHLVTTPVRRPPTR